MNEKRKRMFHIQYSISNIQFWKWAVAGMVAMWAGWGTAEEKAVRELALKECVGLALENNLDFQIEQITREMVALDGQAARGGYDPDLSVSAKRTHEES